MLKNPEKPLMFSGFYYLRQPLCLKGATKNKPEKTKNGTLIDKE